MSKPYTLKSPCADCPFRSDVARYLNPERAQEIMRDSYEDSNFYCHKTVDYSDDNGEGRVAEKSRVCAGFLVTMEKEGRANQPTRIAERLGIYDRTQMDLEAPTYDSMEDWVRSYSRETEDEDGEREHCGVVGPQCSDPAGFAQGGAVFSNPAPPQCSAYCLECESPVCSTCTDRMETVRVGSVDRQVPVCVGCS